MTAWESVVGGNRNLASRGSDTWLRAPGADSRPENLGVLRQSAHCRGDITTASQPQWRAQLRRTTANRKRAGHMAMTNQRREQLLASAGETLYKKQRLGPGQVMPNNFKLSSHDTTDTLG